MTISSTASQLNPLKQQKGFVLPTVLALLAVVGIFGAVILQISLQSFQNAKRQQYIEQAQLASSSGLEYAKEQYELDIAYSGTAETEFLVGDNYRVTYEVEQVAFTNAVNTQQKVKSIGRVYFGNNTTPISVREIIGDLTRLAGSNAAVRFIFIVDNSGSMSIGEWNDSKTTIDIAIQYVLSQIATAEVAILQYGTNTYSEEHKYDVTVPFTSDPATAVTWDRRYGNGTTAIDDFQDHLAASLARMRTENTYGPGAELDLVGATSVQYVLFTDAYGMDFSGCCSALKEYSGSSFDTTNNGNFTTLDQHGEFNALKDGSVYADDGYPDLNAQFTVLNINQTTIRETVETSAAIASPGGTWSGAVDANPGDPEGEGIIPRRYINTSLLQADPQDILDIIDEIIQTELNI